MAPPPKYELSDYGGASRKYHWVYARLVSMWFLALYTFSSMLPIFVVIFAICIYHDILPHTVLWILGLLVVLDYVVPLPNAYKPDRAYKSFMNRIAAEAGQDYFPAKSIFLAENLDKTQSYILASWPHGLLGGASHYGFCDFEKRGYFPIYSGASIIFYVPFLRRLLIGVGFTSVDKAGLRHVLTKSDFPYNIVHLVVGGIHEMFYTPGGSEFEQIIISKRKGFIKLALETGSDIIPLYSFGANEAYYRVAGPKSWLCGLSTNLRVSIVPFFGKFMVPFFFIPRQHPILTVIGQVYKVPKVEKVTDELVQQTHADFCRTLRELFDTYKHVYVKEMGADASWKTRQLKFEDER